jgi:hypothetical protein
MAKINGDIKKAIKDKMRYERISARGLAKACDFDRPQTLSDFLNGTKGIRFDYLQRIFDFLEFEIIFPEPAKDININ